MQPQLGIDSVPGLGISSQWVGTGGLVWNNVFIFEYIFQIFMHSCNVSSEFTAERSDSSPYLCASDGASVEYPLAIHLLTPVPSMCLAEKC